jgi:hypothetical protein
MAAAVCPANFHVADFGAEFPFKKWQGFAKKCIDPPPRQV